MYQIQGKIRGKEYSDFLGGRGIGQDIPLYTLSWELKRNVKPKRLNFLQVKR